MNQQSQNLIRDNPNVSNSTLARLIGVHENTVLKFRRSHDITPKWRYKARGLPFTYQDCDSLLSKVVYRGKQYAKKVSVIDDVDRLLYAIDSGWFDSVN